ncbi:unnamed protein product, partial [Musa textilis]
LGNLLRNYVGKNIKQWDLILPNERYRQVANKHRKRVEFNAGDLVWIHLRKKRFLSDKFRKLKPKADGPFNVLKRIGQNAYEI